MKLRAIALMDTDAYRAAFGPDEELLLRSHVDLVAQPATVASTLATGPLLRQVEAIYSGWGVPHMDRAFLARFPNLRVVFHAAGSVKSFVTQELWQRGVRVTCAARMNAVPVAEFSFAQIVFSLKHGWQRVFEVREQAIFRKEDPHMPGAFGSTVGLLSLGHTGRLVAERLRSLEVNVIAYDPLLSAADASALGVQLVPLEEVFSRAHVISCHTPLLPETVGMLRGSHFALMRRGATFLNTARGAVVDEPELIEVLRRRPDLFAVLDVTDPEPPEPHSPLLSLPNVVLTPHIAGSLGFECRRMARMMIAETERYLRGEPLQGEVFPEQLPVLA